MMCVVVSAFWKQACEYVMDVRRAPNRKTVIMSRKTSIYDDTPLPGMLAIDIESFIW